MRKALDDIQDRVPATYGDPSNVRTVETGVGGSWFDISSNSNSRTNLRPSRSGKFRNETEVNELKRKTKLNHAQQLLINELTKTSLKTKEFSPIFVEDMNQRANYLVEKRYHYSIGQSPQTLDEKR